MDITKDESSSELSDESDEDLLEIISWKEELAERNKAFTEFYKRYRDFLYAAINFICSKFPNSFELSSSIFSNVVINVYNYSGSFNYEGFKDASLIRKKIEGWLIGIAKTEMQRLLTNNKNKVNEEQAMYAKMLSSSRNQNTKISYNEKIVEQAFSLLKEREQHILRTYWLYYEKGDGSQAKNLPPDVLDELAKRYNTTPINIRQIISRSNKTVREFLKKNYKH